MVVWAKKMRIVSVSQDLWIWLFIVKWDFKDQTLTIHTVNQNHDNLRLLPKYEQSYICGSRQVNRLIVMHQTVLLWQLLEVGVHHPPPPLLLHPLSLPPAAAVQLIGAAACTAAAELALWVNAEQMNLGRWLQAPPLPPCSCVPPTYRSGPQWCRPYGSCCRTTCGRRSWSSASACPSCPSRWWRWSPGSPRPQGSSPGSSSWPCAWPSGWGTPGRKKRKMKVEGDEGERLSKVYLWTIWDINTIYDQDAFYMLV